jgi:DNA polymerase III subunit epsilon
MADKICTNKVRQKSKLHAPFVAIDFETANYYRNSACAVGMVRVEDGKIVDKMHQLIRPPTRWFVFTYIHGITWEDVRNEPIFEEIWPDMRKFIRGAKFLAARNASFDSSVLHTCCNEAGIDPPPHRFECTVQISKYVWGIYPTQLADVCEKLRISLDHHNSLSDAKACARIMLRAIRSGKYL